MKDFFLWLFKERTEPFDITFFSIWHILFMVLIFGGTIAAAILIRKKSDEVKERICRGLIITAVSLYVLDMFVMPLYVDSYNAHVDKLPFHICTLMSIVAIFVQFNKKLSFLREPVAFLSIVAPMMYICYPGTAIGDVSPFCYRIIQTFLYHGILFAWGFMRIATKAVVPNIKNCYKSLIALLVVAVWAAFGNAVYEDYNSNWFFLEGGIIPLPEAVEPFLAPVIVIVGIFAMVMTIYGIYYATVAIMKKYSKTETVGENTEEKTEITV
ncbi:MAG: YwaF family protein [Clostridia bacterium]|nr:YwaF family protein [Clostridia bacterium]